MDVKPPPPMRSSKNTAAVIKWRLLVVPVAALGFLGFFINYSTIQFRCHSFCDGPPKTNIVFLKTHKCAGSSIQNILMRFGDVRNLSFALPATDNYFGHPAPFSRAFLQKPHREWYNILTHHTRLDYEEIRAIMPRNTVYVTVIRDPVSLFESMYVYSKLDKFFGIGLRKLARLYPKLNPKFYQRRSQGKLGINQMLFDLGANASIFQNKRLVHEYVDRLESWFDFVLVAERMEESLVLLKELMCWQLDDVVAFRLNARDSAFKSELSERDKANLRHLNAADQILYDRFSAEFQRRVDRFGRERMARESEELRRKTDAWFRYCVRGFKSTESRKGSGYYYNPTVFVYESRADNSNATCNSLTAEELFFTDYLKQKQRPLTDGTSKALSAR